MSGQCHNWDAYPHKLLHEMIHSKSPAPGRDAVPIPTSNGSDSQQAWREFIAVMQDAEERTNAALARAGATWEGAAADSTSMGITPLAQWAADANTAGTASQSSVDDQFSYYSSAKNGMPEPVQVNSTANSDYLGIPGGITHLLGGQTDQDVEEQQAREAKAEAVRVMNGYQTNSQFATSSVGTFVPPPEVAVEVPPPQPQNSTVDSHNYTVTHQRTTNSNDSTTRQRQELRPQDSRPQDSRPEDQRPQDSRPQDPRMWNPLPDDWSGMPDQDDRIRQQFTPDPLGSGNTTGPGTPGGHGGAGSSGGGSGSGGFGAGGFGAGGFGTGTGPRPGGGIPGGPSRSGPGQGNTVRGPGSGAGAFGSSAPASRAAPGAGMPGTAGPMGGPMAAGRGAKPDDDKEHRSPDYLEEDRNIWTDGLPPTPPPVIGEKPPR